MSTTAIMSSSRAQPLHFGRSRELFGVYHAPEGGPRRARAIVLCYPAGHEYLRVHRAFRNLAFSLARSGFPVFRFDYFGTGDSAGEGSEATLSRWRADLGAAIDELKRRAGVRRVSLTGMRLGATIAALESTNRDDLDIVVLWEPVLRGAEYLRQLREVERAWVADPSRKYPQQSEIESHRLVGFPLSPAMEAEIRAVDLAAGPLPRASRAFTLLEADRPEDAAWRDRFRATYGPKSCGVLPAGANWLQPESIHVALFPQLAQNTIVRVFETVAV